MMGLGTLGCKYNHDKATYSLVWLLETKCHSVYPPSVDWGSSPIQWEVDLPHR